jgi:hypothetical protein
MLFLCWSGVHVILTASISRIYVTWQDTDVKFYDDDIEMLKHAAILII